MKQTDFTIIFAKHGLNYQNTSKNLQKFFKILGLAKIQAGLILNLFMISDKNPG